MICTILKRILFLKGGSVTISNANAIVDHNLQSYAVTPLCITIAFTMPSMELSF